MPAQLTIGMTLGTGEPAVLQAPRFARHTFWCGQSGSGKTYALGVVLEQLLLHTRLPLVVLDPNSDFVHLDRVRAGAPEAAASEWASRDIRVLRPGDPRDPLLVRFLSMDVRSRAAVLQLDPVLDADEYNTMLRLDRTVLDGLDGPLVDWLRRSDDPRLRWSATRLENLGISEWDLWAWDKQDVTDIVAERADATVVDLGGFDTPAQLQTVALAILDRLWAERQGRVGRLVVIDEAHNLATPNPRTPLEHALTERITQIAAEGRKYGIWLLMSTQRPSKVPVNIVSQCDNLALMKMSSAVDLDELARIFGFAPAALLARAPTFAKGQALFAGGFAGEPRLVQMGDRLTEEGGTDVEVPLR